MSSCYACGATESTSWHSRTYRVGTIYLCARCTPRPVQPPQPQLPIDDAPTQPGGFVPPKFKEFNTAHHVAEVRPGTGFKFGWGPTS